MGYRSGVIIGDDLSIHDRGFFVVPFPTFPGFDRNIGTGSNPVIR